MHFYSENRPLILFPDLLQLERLIFQLGIFPIVTAPRLIGKWRFKFHVLHLLPLCLIKRLYELLKALPQHLEQLRVLFRRPVLEYLCSVRFSDLCIWALKAAVLRLGEKYKGRLKVHDVKLYEFVAIIELANCIDKQSAEHVVSDFRPLRFFQLCPYGIKLISE